MAAFNFEALSVARLPEGPIEKGERLMDNELREIEALTRELLGVLEGFWSECRASALNKARYLSEEMQGQD
jgi:hypothetical protein